jgi:hypothetical protein
MIWNGKILMLIRRMKQMNNHMTNMVNVVNDSLIKFRFEILQELKVKLKEQLDRKPNWSLDEIIKEVENTIDEINKPPEEEDKFKNMSKKYYNFYVNLEDLDHSKKGKE